MGAVRNLVLVGFMGSGKTAVGERVAPRLGMPFVDLDEVIVERAGKSIVAIFDDDGELEFRRLEREALRSLAAGAGRVLAPGGGAVMDDQSWRFLLDGNLLLRLNASPRALLRRIRNREEASDGSGARPQDIRPLANVPLGAVRWPAADRRRVLNLMAERESRYAQAPRVVDTTGRSVDQVVTAVERLARAAGLGGKPGA